ncbi:glycosyltransferase family 2 protein [Cerasicoccus fimbriatus]|uniref:glycosyltransferase family 2 protein n=1 Tax=Cerasicoccus fimbriatus TaxID=3014554 RepID=UPI0022B40F0B|nr:glycosyltransferase [Cerasicoccus sp. TK19100]
MNNLPESISLVMRSYNEAWAIGDTLKSVFDQDYPGKIELIVIDSASTDGSHEIIRQFDPFAFEILEPGTYVPGKVLNRGMQLATNEWVVYLNSDATPANRQWLSELLKTALATPNLGSAFSRQIPRDDCQAVFAHDYDRCFGPNRESVNWPNFFSMVSCITSKTIWSEFPFREDLQYAEDDEWSRRMKDAGREIVLAEKSIAIHSHNYTLAQSYKRARGDAVAVSKAGHANPVGNKPKFLLMGTVKDALADFKYCQREGRLGEWPHAIGVRWQQRRGRADGYEAGAAERKSSH